MAEQKINHNHIWVSKELTPNEMYCLCGEIKILSEQKIKYKRAKNVKHITLCTCDNSTGHIFDPNDKGCSLAAFSFDELEVYEIEYYIRKKEQA